MSDEQHIVSAYDRDLEAIQAMIMRMGGMAEAAISQAAEALANRDLTLAENVRKDDKSIDALEQQINEEAARIIALRAPMGNDLRTILTVMKIGTDLERIGDYAKNIAKRMSVLAQTQPINGSSKALQRMARSVEAMLHDALDAYVQRSEDLASDVRERDREVDQMYNTLFREFLTYMMEDPRQITVCMHLHFIAKNVERMGDHATNIAEQVIYLVTGELPDESRLKDDETPYVGAE